MRHLVFNVSGLVCKDYSPLGKQKGAGGHHQRHHDWWSVEREQLAIVGLDDFYMTECSERYPAEHLQKDTHKETPPQTMSMWCASLLWT